MGYDAVEDLISRLFSAQRHMPVDPQTVARRVARRLPADLPISLQKALELASQRRVLEWQELDKLGTQIEKEAVDDRNRDLNTLIDALLWGWQRQAPPVPLPVRGLCAYCHRPATGIVRKRPVCPEHVPGTAAAQRAMNISRWAGDWIALRERVFTAAMLVRRTATDSELEALLATTSIEAITRTWWERQPELELPIRIKAHQIVEAEYRAWVREQRANGGRQSGALGGAPQTVPRDALDRAAAAVRRGMSKRAAADQHGVNESTLRRHIRAREKS